MFEHRRPVRLLTGLIVAAALALGLGVAFTPLTTNAARNDGPNPQSAIRNPQFANALVHGQVLWKGTEDVVANVSLALKDATSSAVVMESTTDATGWYTLTVGVGNWLLDIPSTAQYYGYAQELTAMPHGEYVLDFAISPRPASDTPPTATPGAPAVVPVVSTPSSTAPITADTGPAALPANGQPADPIVFVVLGIGALAIIGLGLMLLRRSREG